VTVVRGKEERRRLVLASGLRWTMRRPGCLGPSRTPDGEDPWLCDAGFHRLCFSLVYFTLGLEGRQDYLACPFANRNQVYGAPVEKD